MKLFIHTQKEVSENPTMVDVACLLIKKAQECNFNLNGSEIEYNKHSGYVYLYSLEEDIVLGFEVSNYNKHTTTDEVDLLFCCPVTGEEFVFSCIEDIVDRYSKFIAWEPEDDFPNAIYFNNVEHKINLN